ncbi:MAG: hypothetical protein RIR70_2195 [Pseudomonadota bacterium]|jgi:hypothetical protein
MSLAFFRATRSRRFAWLAIFALMLHTWLPLAAQAQGGTGTLQVCSMAGVKQIAVPADQIPAAPGQAMQHHMQCPVCAAASTAALPSLTQTLFFSALQATAPPLQALATLPSPNPILPSPRGPPCLS